MTFEEMQQLQSKVADAIAESPHFAAAEALAFSPGEDPVVMATTSDDEYVALIVQLA